MKKVGKYRNATHAEKEAWAAATMPDHPELNLNLYPLRGFIQFENRELAVEKLPEGLGTVEVHAPEGMHFSPDRMHTMICSCHADMRDRLFASDLEPCDEECRSEA